MGNLKLNFPCAELGTTLRVLREEWRYNSIYSSLGYSGRRKVSFRFLNIYSRHPVNRVNRASSVGTETRHGLNGPGIESRWGEIFRTRPDRPWGPPSLLYNAYRVFPGGKTAGAWRWPPTTSSSEVKERVQLYLYSTSGPSWPVIGWTLPLPSPLPGR
jgi:hypothetical protein